MQNQQLFGHFPFLPDGPVPWAALCFRESRMGWQPHAERGGHGTGCVCVCPQSQQPPPPSQHLPKPKGDAALKMRASVRMTRYLESWGAARPFAHLNHRESVSSSEPPVPSGRRPKVGPHGPVRQWEGTCSGAAGGCLGPASSWGGRRLENAPGVCPCSPARVPLWFRMPAV